MKECKNCKKIKALWRFPYIQGKVQKNCKTCEASLRKLAKKLKELTPDERVELFV
jgi:hypothetical protein